MTPEALATFIDSPGAQEILGMPNFAFIREAEIFRMTGASIGGRSEAEQAFFLTHLLKLHAEHGPKWREVFTADLKRRIEEINAKLGRKIDPAIIEQITSAPPPAPRYLNFPSGVDYSAYAGKNPDAVEPGAKEPAFFAEIAPGIIGPGPDWHRDAHGTWLRLFMVSVEMDEAAVNEWSDEQLQQADCYCISVHLSAGDHDDIKVPQRPDFFPANDGAAT